MYITIRIICFEPEKCMFWFYLQGAQGPMGIKGHAGNPGIGLPGQKGDRGDWNIFKLYFNCY